MDLHFKSYGSGEVVVILHGLFGMSDNWKSMAMQLSDSYQVILPDLPNHGRSPRLPEFTLDEVARCLFEFFEDQNLTSVRLIGHSLGAKVAMTMALRFPDKVQRLVAVDMAPRKYAPGHDAIFEALLTLDIPHLENRRDAEEALKKSISEEGTRLFLLKNLKRSDMGFEWKFDLPTLYRDYNNILVQIDGDAPFEHPTLFVRGSQSNYIDFNRDEELIYQLFPKAQFETVPEAGHWIHADQPKALENIFRDFLSLEP